MNAHAPMEEAPPITPDPLPQDIMAEQALLGALLLSNVHAAAVSLILERDHFYEQLHRVIYGAIADMIEAGRPADIMTIGAVLADVELPHGAPPIRVYLARLVADAVTVRDAPAWAMMIRDLAHRRDIIAAARRLADEATGADIRTTGQYLLERFETETKMIAEANTALTAEKTSELAWRIVNEIEASRAGEFVVETFTTGFEKLDKLTRYRPEEVIVTAGRPGQGKSVFATAAARRQAMAGIGVLEFPLENGREQAVARHLADLAYREHSPISYSWILDRDVRYPEQAERVAEAAKRLNALPLVIDDAERITIARLGARVRQEKARMAAAGVRLGVVLVDHLDFIDATDRYSGNRVQEIGEIMKGLKAIARRERLTMHLFCQLNRAVEGREDKRPQLADLRNSGDIEQVADVVQFLYREAYYLERSKEVANQEPTALEALEAVRHRLDVITQKSRTSRVGTTNLYVDVRASFVSGRL